MEERPDFGSTTAVIAFVRRRITPTAVWSAVVALTVAIAYVVNAQHDIHNAQADVRRLEESVMNLERERELLHKIDTAMAAMGTKVDDIATEVAHQREWRERIEDAAETPPHAKRKGGVRDGR